MIMLINKRISPKKVDVEFKPIYESNSVVIFLENGIYGFEVCNKLFTNDVLEAVAYLMKSTHLKQEAFWDFEITSKMLYNINPMNTIYWLSGGDEFWDTWEFNWAENIDLYSNKFKNEILKMENVKTLKDIRIIFENNHNLDKFYEFALSKEII